MRAPNLLMRGELRQGRQRTDGEAPVGLDGNPAQLRDSLQIDEPGGLDQVLLQVVEQIDAAGLEDAPRLLGGEFQSLGDARGPRELESVHGLPSFLTSASAASTRSGVIGSCRRRTPVAL